MGDTESSYSYKGVGGSCQFKKSNVAATVTGWTKLPTDEDQLAAWLAKNGPISIGIHGGPMQLYHGGISDPWKIFCNPAKLDHGVLLVGYGEENGKKYWVVKNSWGANWGDDGSRSALPQAVSVPSDTFPTSRPMLCTRVLYA